MQVQRIQNNNYNNASFKAKNTTGKVAYESLKLMRKNLMSSIINGKYDDYVYLKYVYIKKCIEFPAQAGHLRPLSDCIRDMKSKDFRNFVINSLKFAYKNLFRIKSEEEIQIAKKYKEIIPRIQKQRKIQYGEF